MAHAYKTHSHSCTVLAKALFTYHLPPKCRCSNSPFTQVSVDVSEMSFGLGMTSDDDAG